jgi:triosephosphate isomerase (TIM)
MMTPKKPPFIAGNWKMHLTIREAGRLAAAVVEAGPEFREAEIVLIPPFTSLAEVAKSVLGTELRLGAQNLFWADHGAYTGEISAPMLADLGCRYVVIGHSERRQLFSESDETVNKKIRAALGSGLRPIFCLGESLEERQAGRAMTKIGAQLNLGLDGLGPEQFREIIVAYEPIWAIGTGQTATPGQAEEVQGFIRDTLSQKVGKEAAICAIIIYGGSVKPSNSYSLYKEKDIDGFLVGGASLEAESFIAIAKEALRAYKERQ